ncbi:hypothetical protein CVS40_8288 [Lucilia cuprina]|nr:hypothetical protein CVS40_8288 [Lucilia cuprina]
MVIPEPTGYIIHHISFFLDILQNGEHFCRSSKSKLLDLSTEPTSSHHQMSSTFICTTMQNASFTSSAHLPHFLGTQQSESKRHTKILLPQRFMQSVSTRHNYSISCIRKQLCCGLVLYSKRYCIREISQH